MWFKSLFKTNETCSDQFLLLWVSTNQKLLLTKACEDLEQEKQEREEEKLRYLGEKIPPLQVSGLSLEELQVAAADRAFPRKHVDTKVPTFSSESVQAASLEDRRGG